MDINRLRKFIFLMLFGVFVSISLVQEVSAKKITVYSEEYPVTPGVSWYEQDCGQFRGETITGSKLVNQQGTTNEPVKSEVRNADGYLANSRATPKYTGLWLSRLFEIY